MSQIAVPPNLRTNPHFVAKKNEYISHLKKINSQQIDNVFRAATSELETVEQSMLKSLPNEILNCRASDLRGFGYDLKKLLTSQNGRKLAKGKEVHFEDISVENNFSAFSKKKMMNMDSIAKHIGMFSPNLRSRSKKQMFISKARTSSKKITSLQEVSIKPLKIMSQKKFDKENLSQSKWKF